MRPRAFHTHKQQDTRATPRRAKAVSLVAAWRATLPGDLLESRPGLHTFARKAMEDVREIVRPLLGAEVRARKAEARAAIERRRAAEAERRREEEAERADRLEAALLAAFDLAREMAETRGDAFPEVRALADELAEALAHDPPAE